MRVPRAATLLGLLLLSAAFGALVILSLGNALVYYVTPSELAADPRREAVRLYGLVEMGSVRWDEPATTVSFRVTDGSRSMDVSSRAVPTGLFREGIGVVLAGRQDAAGVFVADEILVKHSEVYAPLRPGETMPPGLLESIRETDP